MNLLRDLLAVEGFAWPWMMLAIALPHPNVLNFTSVITLFFTLIYIFIISPHLAFPTSPTPSASSITPTFLGLRK